jgi:hypothetical protein
MSPLLAAALSLGLTPAFAAAPAYEPPTVPAPPPRRGEDPDNTADPASFDPADAVKIQPMITKLAKEQAPDAKPLGSLIYGKFKEGQRVSAQVGMEPGKCYTLIAAASTDGLEVTVRVIAVTPLAGKKPVLGEAAGAATAVLGGGKKCFKWAWPIGAPVTIQLEARKGSGVAAAQLFEK